MTNAPYSKRQAGLVVTQGQRVEIPLSPAGTLVGPGFQSLLRAEDASVKYWQINVAPIFRRDVGPVIEGMPGFAFPALGRDPNVRLRMTWGGGGVNFRTEMFYPSTGASFVVSGDNVQLEVGLNGPGSVFFLPGNTPQFSAWAKPLAAPTANAPLLSGFNAPEVLYGPRFISPWTKALHVGVDTPGATVTLRLYSSPALFCTFVWTAAIMQGVARIPIADASYMAEVFADVGNVMVAEEYAFT
jgi:hypothetical protein